MPARTVLRAKPQPAIQGKPQPAIQAKPRTPTCAKCPSIRRRLRIYFRSADVLDLLANLALVVIAAASLNTLHDAFKLPKPLLACAAAYILFTICRFIMVVRARAAMDYELRRTICRVFHLTYEEMFDSHPMQEWMRILERTLDRLYEENPPE